MLSNMTFFLSSCLPSTLSKQFLLDTSKKMNKEPFQTKSKSAFCLSEAVTPPCGEAEERFHFSSYIQLQHTLIYNNMIPVIDRHRRNSFFVLCLPPGTWVCRVSESTVFLTSSVWSVFIKNASAYESQLFWGLELLPLVRTQITSPNLITAKSTSVSPLVMLHTWKSKLLLAITVKLILTSLTSQCAVAMPRSSSVYVQPKWSTSCLPDPLCLHID